MPRPRQNRQNQPGRTGFGLYLKALRLRWRPAYFHGCMIRLSPESDTTVFVELAPMPSKSPVPGFPFGDDRARTHYVDFDGDAAMDLEPCLAGIRQVKRYIHFSLKIVK